VVRIAKPLGKVRDVADQMVTVWKGTVRKGADPVVREQDLGTDEAPADRHGHADQGQNPEARATVPSLPGASAVSIVLEKVALETSVSVAANLLRVASARHASVVKVSVRNRAGAASVLPATSVLNLRATQSIAGLASTVAADAVGRDAVGAATVGPARATFAAGHAAENVMPGPATVRDGTATAALAVMVLRGILASAELDAARASRGTRCTGMRDSVDAVSHITDWLDAASQGTVSHATVSRDVGITASGTTRSPVTLAVATVLPVIKALLIAVVGADVPSPLITAVADRDVGDTDFAGTVAVAGAVGRGLPNVGPERISMRSSPRPTPTKTAS
jgi:hypothetical protein